MNFLYHGPNHNPFHNEKIETNSVGLHINIIYEKLHDRNIFTGDEFDVRIKLSDNDLEISNVYDSDYVDD